MTNLQTVEQIIDAADTAHKRNIAQRINAAMAEVDYIQKQKPKADGMNYSYVSHDAVTAKVRPILQAHGIVYYPRDLHVTQSDNRTEAIFVVRFENMDDRADFIDVATFGYGVDKQDKGPGKAMSYGVKYALLKVLGLETGDDPEQVQDERADYRPEARGRISMDQFNELRDLLEKTGVTNERFCKRFQLDAVAELPTGQFAEAKEALEAKAKGSAQ